MTKVHELLTKLQQDGVSENEIAVIVAEVTKAASLKLYTQLVHAIDESDRQLLEETAGRDEEETQQLLEVLYKKYYQISANEAVTELQEQFATDFLKNYTAQAANASV